MWEHTSALEGQVSTIEDDMVPWQRDVGYNGHLTAQQAACLDNLESKMRCNNVHAIDILEWAKGKNLVTFID